MSLNRRGFFGTIVAAFVARALPVQPTRISTAAMEHAMHSQDAGLCDPPTWHSYSVNMDDTVYYVMDNETWRYDRDGYTRIEPNRDTKTT